jgi:hypothetical protein
MYTILHRMLEDEDTMILQNIEKYLDEDAASHTIKFCTFRNIAERTRKLADIVCLRTLCRRVSHSVRYFVREQRVSLYN